VSGSPSTAFSIIGTSSSSTYNDCALPGGGVIALEHPLAPGLARLRGLSEFLNGDIGRAPGGWTSLARLSADWSLLDDASNETLLPTEAPAGSPRTLLWAEWRGLWEEYLSP
jgi:hypothetical protein